MMKYVYVVRHCKADGQEPDAKLTELGIQQAENLAKFLLDKDIDFIISSPFERAYRTIAPLAEQIGIEVVLDDRLAERLLSRKNHPDWRNMLRKTYDDLDICYEGGESSNTAMSRAISVVMEVLNGENKNIVLVWITAWNPQDYIDFFQSYFAILDMTVQQLIVVTIMKF